MQRWRPKNINCDKTSGLWSDGCIRLRGGDEGRWERWRGEDDGNPKREPSWISHKVCPARPFLMRKIEFFEHLHASGRQTGGASGARWTRRSRGSTAAGIFQPHQVSPHTQSCTVFDPQPWYQDTLWVRSRFPWADVTDSGPIWADYLPKWSWGTRARYRQQTLLISNL